MTVEIIDKYLNEVLYPRLNSYQISEEALHKVGSDINNRLHSILYHWKNTTFRQTTLVTGIEEAYFYQAPLQIEIRCLVVLAIRNSLFEDLVSTDKAAQSLGLEKTVIPELDVRKFTSDAILFFSKFDMSVTSDNLQEPEHDLYGILESTYPIAWNVLQELGSVVFQNKKYAKLDKHFSKIKNFDVKLNSNNVINIEQNMKKTTVVLSGMDPNIDPHLFKVLTAIQEGLPMFFSDSFKSITRNPEKLFKVIENILVNNASVVTSNFYLSQEYVSSRTNFTRPGHTNIDIIENIKNKNGLSKTHLNALKVVLNDYS